MIIDCHGHYTTAPKALEAWRHQQVQALGAPVQAPSRASLSISDDEIRESLEGAQLRVQRERGTDVTFFSPRASFMAHHIGDARTSADWSYLCNELIHRVCSLYPENFVGVCQLPQSPGVPPANCIEELERCVREYGFIGCNLNPDPSGGHWKEPPLTDLAQDMKRPPLKELLLNNVFFDTCVYHRPGVELLLKVIPVDNILFASEMIGAVRGIDPDTGHYFDDTKRYIDQIEWISAGDRAKLFEGNARRVFPRFRTPSKPGA